MKIAYLLSMKKGLPSFIYREIQAYLQRNVSVVIMATKYDKGVYMAPEGAGFYRLNFYTLIFYFIATFIKNPVLTLKLLSQSTKYKTTGHFLIACQFSEKMKKENVDKIHCQEGLHNLWIGYYCNKLLSCDLYVTVHADTIHFNPNETMTKLALENCKYIMTISEFNKTKLIEKFQVSADKIHVVRIAIDVGSFIPRDRKVILIVGQYAERKGHETLFKAVQSLNHDIEIWIVSYGTWGKGVDVNKMARDMGIEDKCVFINNIPEDLLRILYRNCDIFCLPCRTASDGDAEGIPTSLMEAMSSGKPVVSTYHTGIPELVEEYLVPEGDWKELAKTLDFLLKNEDEWIIQGKRNRQKIINEFSTSNYDKFLDILSRE